MSKSRKSQRIMLFVAIGFIIIYSFFLEFLGYRIIDTYVSFINVIGLNYFFGALKTAGGAILFGTLLVMCGCITKKTRLWTFSHLTSVFGIGSGLFLLAITLLVAWAF